MVFSYCAIFLTDKKIRSISMLEQVIFPEFITGNFIIRLFVASLLGAVIGLERDIHGRAAGLRTNLLISLGAAVFMLVSEAIAVSYTVNTGDSVIAADPGRIAAQVVTGIGFLGAGAIIKHGFSIRGLTTAACIWISAGIGMSAGAGFFEVAIVTTVLGLFSLVILNWLERKYAKYSYRILEIVTANDINISEVIDTVKRKDLKILFLDNRIDYDDKKMYVKFTIRIHHKGITDKLSQIILKDLEESGIPIHQINWLFQ
jgi:putative Mg2+ transporter-C (MgtC) family protein